MRRYQILIGSLLLFGGLVSYALDHYKLGLDSHTGLYVAGVGLLLLPLDLQNLKDAFDRWRGAKASG